MPPDDREPTEAPSPLLTRAEYAALDGELERLRVLRDHDLPAQLREAWTYVGSDAAEESAWLVEEQTRLHARIASLERILARATVPPDDAGDGTVTLGSVVEVVYPRTGRQATYHLTGTGTAGPGDAAAVSARSPVGGALMGARAGDVVRAHLPRGRTEDLRIVAVDALRPAA
jgi:transcription elongation factor GreA